MSLLELQAVNTFYGDSHILFDVSLTVARHECAAVIGTRQHGSVIKFHRLPESVISQVRYIQQHAHFFHRL